MKVFVWKYLGQVSNSYHSGGGLLIVAEDLEAAMKLAAEKGPKDSWWGGNDGPLIVIDKEPDLVFEVDDHEPQVVVFPNAGCC